MFKEGDLITGTSKALDYFEDSNLSDEAILEVINVNDDYIICNILSNAVDDSDVGETVFIDVDDAHYFELKQAIKITAYTPLTSYTANLNPVTTNSSSELSRIKLLKAKGLL